jgi:hypothetical protein
MEKGLAWRLRERRRKREELQVAEPFDWRARLRVFRIVKPRSGRRAVNVAASGSG